MEKKDKGSRRRMRVGRGGRMRRRWMSEDGGEGIRVEEEEQRGCWRRMREDGGGGIERMEKKDESGWRRMREDGGGRGESAEDERG